MRVSEIMSSRVLAISPRDAAERAWSQMRLKRVRHLVVMDGSRVVGVLSDRDLGGRNGAVARRGRTVSEVMTPDVVSVGPSTTLRQASNLMRGRTIGCLPVVEDGRVVGIVTITDILDQLGRGSTRPSVKAERWVRRAPAGHHRLGDAERVPVRSGQEEKRRSAKRTVRPKSGRLPRSPSPRA